MTISISSDIIAIIALSFTIYLAKRNIVINNYKNKIYISVALVTIILILLEISTVLMEAINKNNFRLPLSVANMVGFSLCPVVPFILFLFNSNKGKKYFYSSLFALPLYLNAFMCLLSYKTGWIFFINTKNQYTRGSLFLIPTIISFFYFILMIKSIIKNNVDYENNDKKILVSILFVPFMGTIVQILFKDVLLIWGSAAISLLLYYIFLRELQFNYDVQTGIRNRLAFKKEMEQYLKDDKNAVIIVFDLNELKNTNDKYGHRAGDEIIECAAKIISESFSGIGKAFRIGGDEFCVICKETPSELVDSALSNLGNLLITVNQQRNIQIQLAYGYASHTKSENQSKREKESESENIYATFSQADQAMYAHKAELKGFYGRRVDD